MVRIAELRIDALTEAQKKAHLGTPSRHGKIQGPAIAWMRIPQLYEHLNAMIRHMRFEGVLAPRICEFAILIVVADWNSAYPWSAHAVRAKEAGLAPDIIEAIHAHRRPDFRNADEQAVYAFHNELRDTHAVSDATYQTVLQHVGEQGVIELTILLGLYAIVAMTANTFEITVPE